MASSRPKLDISKEALKPKIELFLKSLAVSDKKNVETLPEWAGLERKRELCASFNFMMVRADAAGKINNEIERRHWLAELSNEDIKKYAALIKKYGFKNKNIPVEDKVKLAQAQDLYYYTQTLLAATAPGAHFDLRTENGFLTQYDILGLLRFLPPNEIIVTPDVESKESKSHVNIQINQKEIFAFDYNFDQKQYTDTLKKVLRQDDRVVIFSDQHALYISGNDKGGFRLYDTNYPTGWKDFNDINALAKEITARAFLPPAEHEEPREIFPLGLRILDRLDAKPVTSRPTESELLKELKLPLHASSVEGDTPLHLAVERGNFAMVKVLLDAGASPNLKNYHDELAMDIAAQAGNVSMMKMIAERRPIAPSDSYSLKLACYAAEYGHMKLIQYLAELKVPFDKVRDDRGKTPIGVAASEGRWDCVAWMLLHTDKAHSPLLENKNEYQLLVQHRSEIAAAYSKLIKLDEAPKDVPVFKERIFRQKSLLGDILGKFAGLKLSRYKIDEEPVTKTIHELHSLISMKNK